MIVLDVKGKVKNMTLARSRALLPVFEAIVNSFHSIQSLKDKSNTFINIKIERDLSQVVDDKHKDNGEFYPITDFIIEDNGVGFNEENYKSFLTSDSTYKTSIGGKGIGRFLWLKAFENIEVDSIYTEDNKTMNRNFTFSLDDEPIKVINFSECDCKERITRIKLNNFKDIYRNSCTRKLDLIGIKVIEHCMSFFLLDDCPNVTLEDKFDKICLNNLFKEKVSVNTTRDKFNIKGNEFEISHVKLYYGNETTNRLHFCANNREVDDINLAKLIPTLNGKIKKDEEKEFIYSAYIFGNYLDDNVNAERTSFIIPDSNDMATKDLATMDDIKDEAIKLIKHYLRDYIHYLNEKKQQKIIEYVNHKSPQYKLLTKYKKEDLENIPANLSEQQLELELFKISQKLNLEIKQTGEKLLNKKIDDIKNIDSYKKDYQNYIEKVNDSGKANLAQYIVHRKVIIKLLEEGLKIKDNSKYQLEDYIHKLIFPMRTVSDDIDFERHNLWLVDERLAYHYYLASDMKFKDMQHLDTNDEDRPDVMIINNPIAVVNQDEKPYNSVVILEFKRPMRNAYDDEENPFSQVYRYVKKIREGTQRDKDGRSIRINSNTPFYLYILCDITANIEEQCINYNLTKTPDDMGYFGFNKNISAYVEVISYDKLVEDAKKRNKILFDKLFSPQY
jgi:hypothetical protein